jgi:hypothetical protein
VRLLAIDVSDEKTRLVDENFPAIDAIDTAVDIDPGKELVQPARRSAGR